MAAGETLPIVEEVATGYMNAGYPWEGDEAVLCRMIGERLRRPGEAYVWQTKNYTEIGVMVVGHAADTGNEFDEGVNMAVQIGHVAVMYGEKDAGRIRGVLTFDDNNGTIEHISFGASLGPDNDRSKLYAIVAHPPKDPNIDPLEARNYKQAHDALAEGSYSGPTRVPRGEIAPERRQFLIAQAIRLLGKRGNTDQEWTNRFMSSEAAAKRNRN